MTPKLICFDMDGVMVDACNLHKRALEEAMQEELGYKISDEDHYSKFNGLPTRKKLSMLGLEAPVIERINSLKQKYTHRLISSCIEPDQSKIDLLEWCVFSKIQVACVTNSIKDTTLAILSKADILKYFSAVITTDDIVNPKPSPEPYMRAMQRLGKLSNETVIVEDSDVGFSSAVASGARCVRVSGPAEVNITLVPRLIQ